jgi:hypothetical protein
MFNWWNQKTTTRTCDISKGLKTKIWKKFNIDDIKKALQASFSKERDGRILLDII